MPWDGLRLRPERAIFALVVAAPVLYGISVVACGGYPPHHNRYVHPLGRLSRSISMGDDCAALRETFLAYSEARREDGSREVEFAERELTMDLLHTKQVAPSRGLWLYDVSAFDDLQLTVRCSPTGQVAEVQFVGD
jgi:hypothetical protein